MKLIETLYNEYLDNNLSGFTHGWAAQDNMGVVEFYQTKPTFMGSHYGHWCSENKFCGYNKIDALPQADDYKTTTISHEEFMKYVANKDVDAWHNTTNVPPVGTECWMCFDSGKATKCKITAIGEDSFLARVKSWGWDESKFIMGSVKFKKLVSEEEEKAIKEIEAVIYDNRKLNTRGLAEKLFELGYRRR